MGCLWQGVEAMFIDLVLPYYLRRCRVCGGFVFRLGFMCGGFVYFYFAFGVGFVRVFSCSCVSYSDRSFLNRLCFK